MIFDGVHQEEERKYISNVAQSVMREYLLHRNKTADFDTYTSERYDAAVALCAAERGLEPVFAELFRECICIFEARGHIVVVAEAGRIRRYAAHAAGQTDTFIIWQENMVLEQLFDMFSDACGLAAYSFYSGNAARADTIRMDAKLPAVDERRIERLMHSESYERIKAICERYFSDIMLIMPEPAAAVSGIARLIKCLMRGASDELMREVAGELVIAGGMKIPGYSMLCQSIIERIHRERGEDKKLSPLIADTLEIIERNLSNEDLSLRWIAQEILYTNADYLGKLFKKEIGYNFTGYVKRMRMELAKKMILNGKRDRIYEVAEKVGFGTNSQYFSQVFKKYTGVSPIEYKSVMQQNEAVNNLYDIHMGENV